MRYGMIIFLAVLFAPAWSSADDKIPYKTIEEAVLATGGTVAVMDTKDPDSAESAAQAIMDRGLTGSDDRGAGREQTYAGLQFRGRLVRDRDMKYITYRGQRGERLRVTVRSSDFVPELRGWRDANGQWGEKFKDYREDGSVAEAMLECPYAGIYEFAVSSRGFNSTGYGAFILSIQSDKSAATNEVLSDNLVPGQTYTVREIKQNQSAKEREFFLEAYCVFLKEDVCPPCPPTHRCKTCPPPYNVGFADDAHPRIDFAAFQAPDVLLIQSIHDPVVFSRFKIGERYRLKIRVINQSRTNIPNNYIRFLSIVE